LRASQKNGSVVLKEQEGRVPSWNFLWWENGKRKSRLLGSIIELPQREDAEKKAAPLRRQLGRHQPVPTIATLVERYRAEKMPQRMSTQHGYNAWLDNHILPRWGECKLTELQPRPVEMWLQELDLAPKSRSHIRGVLAILWNFAMWRGDIPVGENPMELVSVHGVKKRARKPRILEPEQFQALLTAIGDDLCLRTMVLVALSFGLRISEVLGLKWGDVDWLGNMLNIERGVVKQVVDSCKTEESARSMAIAPELIEVLSSWKQATQFSEPGDWIFASPVQLGRRPLSYTHVWGSLDRVARAADLGHLSSHAFRHTYRSWLDSVGTPVGVQQKMMRHADIRTTMSYGDALTNDKREAGQKVARIALGRA
jgi:integrase